MSHKAIVDHLETKIKEEWAKQGHRMSEAFEDALFSEVSTNEGINIKVIDGTKEGYGAIQNRGVPAENWRYPYAPKKIAGLMRYAQARFGEGEKEARATAYKIATKHKQEGMPTAASSVHSSTGERTKFAQAATDGLDDVLVKHFKQTVVKLLFDGNK